MNTLEFFNAEDKKTSPTGPEPRLAMPDFECVVHFP